MEKGTGGGWTKSYDGWTDANPDEQETHSELWYSHTNDITTTSTTLYTMKALLLCCIIHASLAFVTPNLNFYAYPSTALFAKKSKKKKRPKDSTIAVNRAAYRNYEVIDTLECGISLLGTEVKSIREGKMNLKDGFVKASQDGRGCTLHNVHISKHRMSGEYFQHEETRVRPLLVHKEQARKLKQQTEKDGMTMVPVKAYFNEQNKVKIMIGICKGKNVRDKRQTIKEREAKRETSRMVKNFRL